MPWSKAIALAAYLLAWFTRASADGRITLEEVVQAVTGAISTLGLGFAVELPREPVTFQAEPGEPGEGPRLRVVAAPPRDPPPGA